MNFESFSDLKKYQQKVRLFTYSFSSTLAAVLIVVMLVQIFIIGGAHGATYTFTQNSWTGGATANSATHPGDKTGWDEYSSKDSQITAGNNIQLSSTNSSASHTTESDFASSNGSVLTHTSDADFSTGSNSNTVIPGTGSVSSIQLEDAYTKLLLHGDGNNNGTIFFDDSPNNLSPTVNGGIVTSNMQAKFGSKSIFGPSGGYLSYANHSDLIFGTGQFTVEGWFYKSTAGENSIIANKKWNSNGWQLYVNSSNRYYLEVTGASINLNATATAGAWQHFALVRNDTNLMFFFERRKDIRHR